MFSLCLFFDGPIRPTTARVGTCGDPSMTPFGDMSFCTPRMQLPLLPSYAMTDDGEHCHGERTLQQPQIRPIIACGDPRSRMRCKSCNRLRALL